ncbi:MAG: GNAT family N-acetyltransferase, partial [Thermofilaceae archaeon]
MGLRFSVERVEPGVYKVTAFEGDAAVSWLYIIDVWLHYGASNVLAGGIAGVYTPREHRGKGFSAATLRYTIEWMREQGYPLSALFGIFEY